MTAISQGDELNVAMARQVWGFDDNPGHRSGLYLRVQKQRERLR
ncbi:MAG TPA: hypothetical protein VKP30_26605 [Polyangiaceae bacterium]|nr:hypothetical protein [Polyangiaceae bacterium]